MHSPGPMARALLSIVLAGSVACDNASSTSPVSSARSRQSSANLSSWEGATGARAIVGSAAPTIVLVHGAFADASGWQEIIPLLQDDGYRVVAVQNPLTALRDDVASTRRVIDAQPGDVVLVGHSYGGAVITGAADGSTKVKSLVYIAAFAPDIGESVQSMSAMFPPTPLTTALSVDAAGFAYIDVAKYREVFAGDLPRRQTRVMAVTQKPASLATLGDQSLSAAWRTVPSWYVVARQDQTINPELERFLAKRMRAHTSEITSSHLPFISHPQEIAAVIREAAAAAVR